MPSVRGVDWMGCSDAVRQDADVADPHAADRDEHVRDARRRGWDPKVRKSTRNATSADDLPGPEAVHGGGEQLAADSARNSPR